MDHAEFIRIVEQAVQKALAPYKSKGDQKKYLNAEEAWQYLNLPSIKSLYQLTSRKSITSIKRGKRLAFLKEDLDLFMMKGRRDSADTE